MVVRLLLGCNVPPSIHQRYQEGQDHRLCESRGEMDQQSHCPVTKVNTSHATKTFVDSNFLKTQTISFNRNKASAGVPISTTTDGINTIVEQLQ